MSHCERTVDPYGMPSRTTEWPALQTASILRMALRHSDNAETTRSTKAARLTQRAQALFTCSLSLLAHCDV